MQETFYCCRKLIETLIINASPTSYAKCLFGVSTEPSALLKLIETSTKLTEVLNTKSPNSKISL